MVLYANKMLMKETIVVKTQYGIKHLQQTFFYCSSQSRKSKRTDNCEVDIKLQNPLNRRFWTPHRCHVFDQCETIKKHNNNSQLYFIV